MEDEDEKLETFFQWAANLGVTDSPSLSQNRASSCLGESVVVSCFPEAGGRGLASIRELTRGELILRVPKAALFTRDSVLEDPSLSFRIKRYPRLSSAQILVVCLLAEVGKGRNSQWAPYLMQLPRFYHTLSSFVWFEIQALQVDDAIWASEKAVSRTQSEWKDALLLMQEIGLRPQLLTFKSWLWACGTVSTRTMHIPWDDAGCLCPVGDFANYAAPEDDSHYTENVENSPRLTDGVYEKDLAAYCFYARKHYRKGEQVLLCYGTYTNLELLEHYGFVLNSNPSDKAFIPLEADIQSSSPWASESLYIQPDGKPSFALLSTLRLWATPQKLRKTQQHLTYEGALFSVENEVLVMEWLAKRCLDVLNKLPTTLEEDCALLEAIDEHRREKSKVLMGSEPELIQFFQEHGLQGGCQIPNKVVRSMQRWELAVKWRYIYKKTIAKCVTHCSQMLSDLSSQI
ncbi:protein SET DOMAIN GROUP 40 [Aristolochia californica]|uniref:protein SET DOMAIN GROUP 40 n=1 Tax=Aristolochia californica TaxID=171875 RepID=UPI0035D741DF